MQRSGRVETARFGRMQKMGGKTMTNALRRALIHEQNLNEALRERVLELEAELRTLQLKLAAKYAAQVDDN